MAQAQNIDARVLRTKRGTPLLEEFRTDRYIYKQHVRDVGLQRLGRS